MIPHKMMNLVNRGKAFELIIIDNKENTNLNKAIRGNEFLLNERLSPGLYSGVYHWTLQVDKEMIYAGKFQVIALTSFWPIYQGNFPQWTSHGSSTSPKVLTASITRSHPKSSPLSARRCVWKREPGCSTSAAVRERCYAPGRAITESSAPAST